MLNNSSTQIGVNLALIANDRKIDLTPKPGSLLQELSLSAKNQFDIYPGTTVSELPGFIAQASSGSAIVEAGTQSYAPSSHDSLMDNYIVELSQLVSSHVVFARSVVQHKVSHLEEAVQAALQSYQIKEAEDFFEVRFYKQPELFKSYLVEDEVMPMEGRASSPEVVNFGDHFAEGFDVSAYFATGEDDIDRLVQEWIAQTGKDVIMSYLAPKSANFESQLFGPAAVDYYMANYLLYRQFSIKQDLPTNLSALQVTTLSAVNRDYHASQLAFHLSQYKQTIRFGALLTPDSQTKFSYLSPVKFNITVYEESFAQLQDQDSVLEKIYGSIARYGARDLTVEAVKAHGADYLHQWKGVRSLYTTYLLSSRVQLLKSSLKLMLPASIDADCGEEKDSPIFNEDYRVKSLQAANEYIDQLQASDADDLYKVCMEVMARIVYRFSNAYFFLREMYEIMESDKEIDVIDAAHAAVVRYVTDFLLEQLDVSKTLKV